MYECFLGCAASLNQGKRGTAFAWAGLITKASSSEMLYSTQLLWAAGSTSACSDWATSYTQQRHVTN